MRYTADEKREIIKLVEQSSLPISQTLKRLDINKSTFYNWLGLYPVDPPPLSWSTLIVSRGGLSYGYQTT